VEVYKANIVAMSGGAMAFVRNVLAAKTLTFEFTPFDGSPHIASFDLRGLDGHMSKVAGACGWAMDSSGRERTPLVD